MLGCWEKEANKVKKEKFEKCVGIVEKKGE